MGKYFLLFLMILFCDLMRAQESCKPCNYIDSGYYQYVYQGDLEMLKGNQKKAYQYFQKAEKACPMIQTMGYYEMYKYTTLLLEYKEYKKALYYMNYLIANNGYKLDDFSSLKNYQKLNTTLGWDSIYTDFADKEANFRFDTILVEKFQEMGERDQRDRRKMDSRFYDGSSYRNENKILFDSLLLLVKHSDDTNYFELMELFDVYGFPLAKNNKLSPYAQSVIWSSLLDIFIHIGDTARTIPIESYLLSLIANGDCPPLLYACLIDRRKLNHGELYIYGIYDQDINGNPIFPDHVYDPENMDKRRIFIGIPPLQMEYERRKLLGY